MLITILLLLAATAAAVGAVSGLAYPFACTALERHLATPRPDYSEDKEGCSAWTQLRWALDKTRTRVAIPGFFAYGIGMGLLIWVQALLKGAERTSNLPLILMIVLSVALMIIGLRSAIHNSREFESDLKRRYPYA